MGAHTILKKDGFALVLSRDMNHLIIVGLLFFTISALAEEAPSFPLLKGACLRSRGSSEGHRNAIDLLQPAKDKSILSPCDGTLKMIVDNGNGYGNHAYIRCGTGPAKGYELLLAHMQDEGLARSGDIKKGTRVGLVGNTGYSTGAHLHVEVKLGGKAVTHRFEGNFQKNFCGAGAPKKPAPSPLK